MNEEQSRPVRHGAEEKRSGLIVVDMLNRYEHEDAEKLAGNVEPAIDPLRSLLDRARGGGVAVIYVNDNYGDWNTSAKELAESAMEGKHPELVEPILPPDEIAFVMKARHSIFYMTLLEYLLDRSGINRLVLAGQVTEQCILYSALDAYVRHFEVAIARDAVAPIHENLGEAALEMMDRNMRAEIADAAEIELSRSSAKG